METTVIVALLGDLAQLDWAIREDELRRPYAERHKLELSVTGSETLGDTMRRAAEELDAAYPHTGQRFLPAYIAFYTPEDEGGFAGQISYLVPLVDGAGHVTWGHRYSEATWDAVFRAAAAGALAGDPRRPYFVARTAVGNGVLPDWHTVLHVLEVVKLAVESYGLAHGAIEMARGTQQLLRRLQDRLARGQQAIQQQHVSWQERGGDPYLVDEWLDDRPWHPNDLARLLDCPTDQAEAVLWAFGFAPTAGSGLWRRHADEEATFIAHANTAVLSADAGSASEADLESYFGRQVEQLAQTGRASPYDWRQLDWLDVPQDLADEP